MGHTANYDPTMRCVYIFGGSKNSRWFHDVHVYDLDENKWTLAKVRIIGGRLSRDQINQSVYNFMSTSG